MHRRLPAHFTRGSEAHRRSAVTVLLALAVSGCTAAIGGGVTAVAVTIGALSAACYDYANITVFDAVTGHSTCDATVTAARGSDVLELTSCYYAPLTAGTWTIRASEPGHSDAVTSLTVVHDDGCIRHVQSVELTLTQPGAGSAFTPRSAPVAPASSASEAPASRPANEPAPSSPAEAPPATAPLTQPGLPPSPANTATPAPDAPTSGDAGPNATDTGER